MIVIDKKLKTGNQKIILVSFRRHRTTFSHPITRVSVNLVMKNSHAFPVSLWTIGPNEVKLARVNLNQVWVFRVPKDELADTFDSEHVENEEGVMSISFSFFFFFRLKQKQ